MPLDKLQGSAALEANRHDLQFLESTTNLKQAIKRSQGWTPNSGQAEGIVACLRQGRLFYAAAAEAPLEIKPLQLYYGMVAFAKALTLASDRKLAINSLAQSHGIKDTSEPDATLGELVVAIEKSGTFQAFNDCAAGLNRVSYISTDTSQQVFSLPCTLSSELGGVRLSLKEILSRVPGVWQLYEATFSERSDSGAIFINAPLQHDGPWEIRIDDKAVCSELSELRRVVARWRSLAPFLQKWTLSSAQFAWGNTVLIFENFSHSGDDLGEAVMQKEERRFTTSLQATPEDRFADIAAYLDSSISGNDLNSQTSVIRPVNGMFIQEYSLQYLALHLLSSLVRYRPSIWMHSLSRASSAERPADDAMLALVEKFMVVNQSSVPNFVCQVLNPDLRHS